MPHPSTQVVKGASELRLVLGQLVRRLRAEYSFPVAQASVLSRLDREGAQTASALAAVGIPLIVRALCWHPLVRTPRLFKSA